MGEQHKGNRFSRRGVSMIELIIALAVVALLAAIALPRLQRARNRAQETLVSSDLERLGFLQEQHLALGARKYARNLAELKFTPSTGVSVEVLSADDRGWAAQATHTKEPDLHCAVFHSAEQTNHPWPAKQPGEINCGRRPRSGGTGPGVGARIR